MPGSHALALPGRCPMQPLCCVPAVRVAFATHLSPVPSRGTAGSSSSELRLTCLLSSRRVSRCGRRSARPLAAVSRPCRAALVRAGVLERQGASASSNTVYASDWSPQQQQQQQPYPVTDEGRHAQAQWVPPDSGSDVRHREEEREEEADHSGNQITLFLSLSVTLITLPWVYRHPETLLVPAALLALPMPGSALRPALLEGFQMVFAAARWIVDSHGSSTAAASSSANIPASNDRQQQQQPHSGVWHGSAAGPSAQQAHGPYSPLPAYHNHAAADAHQQQQQQQPYYTHPGTMQQANAAHASPYAPPARSPGRNDPGAFGPSPHDDYGSGYAPPSEAQAQWAPSAKASGGSMGSGGSMSSVSSMGSMGSLSSMGSMSTLSSMDGHEDVDWPAGSSVGVSSSSNSNGGAAAVAGGAGDVQAMTWQQRHPRVYQNLDEGPGPVGASNRVVGYSHHSGYDASAQPLALGPYSAWPQARGLQQQQQPYHGQQQQQQQHSHQHPSPQRPHSDMGHPVAPQAASEQLLDGHPQLQSRGSGVGSGNGSGGGVGAPEPTASMGAAPGWARPLFSVAPWMRSWGGFL